jgi:hypothetical protein
VEKVAPSLVALTPRSWTRPSSSTPLVPERMFLGPPDKYAILNGTVYREGAELPDGV